MSSHLGCMEKILNTVLIIMIKKYRNITYSRNRSISFMKKDHGNYDLPSAHMGLRLLQNLPHTPHIRICNSSITQQCERGS